MHEIIAACGWKGVVCPYVAAKILAMTIDQGIVVKRCNIDLGVDIKRPMQMSDSLMIAKHSPDDNAARRRQSVSCSDDVGDNVGIRAKCVRVLHVEDDETIARLAKEMLEIEGWEVESCADGNAALAKISEETDYDLLLMDYDLPGVNGLEIVSRARKLAHRSHTPIVVLSAIPVETAAREAGADAFLHKPQDIGSLVETITRLLGGLERES